MFLILAFGEALLALQSGRFMIWPKGNAKSGTRCFGETLQCARRGQYLATFQTSDDGLRRTHRVGHFFLSHIGLASGLDERRR